MHESSIGPPRQQIGPGGNGVSPGAKKLVIKNFKAKPALPDNFEERSIAKLRRAVVAIQKAERIDTSLEELYQAVENLCNHGKAEQVYANLRDLVEAHVQVSYSVESIALRPAVFLLTFRACRNA